VTEYSGTKSGKWFDNHFFPKSMEKQEMAVLIDIDMTLIQLMEKLGCDASLIFDAQKAKLQAQYQADGILIKTTADTIFKEGSSKKADALAPIMLGTLTKIVQGDPALNGTAKNVVKIQLQKSIKLVLQHVNLDVIDTVIDHTPDLDLAYAVFPPLETEKSVDVGVEKKDFSTVFAVAGGITLVGKPKLINATELYQPVQGSEESSTYYTIAIRPELKVAVRIKPDNQCSIRAEVSDKSQALATVLLKSGLKSSNSHYSMHFHASSEDLVRRTVGAVLFNIGINFTKMTLDLMPVWNKGT
jgi:hypothetical protein